VDAHEVWFEKAAQRKNVILMGDSPGLFLNPQSLFFFFFFFFFIWAGNAVVLIIGAQVTSE
jgi:hypothetical protein